MTGPRTSKVSGCLSATCRLLWWAGLVLLSPSILVWFERPGTPLIYAFAGCWTDPVYWDDPTLGLCPVGSGNVGIARMWITSICGFLFWIAAGILRRVRRAAESDSPADKELVVGDAEGRIVRTLTTTVDVVVLLFFTLFSLLAANIVL